MPNGAILHTIQLGNLTVRIHAHTWRDGFCDLAFTIERFDELEQEVVPWFDFDSLQQLADVESAVREWLDRDSEATLPHWLREPGNQAA